MISSLKVLKKDSIYMNKTSTQVCVWECKDTNLKWHWLAQPLAYLSIDINDRNQTGKQFLSQGHFFLEYIVCLLTLEIWAHIKAFKHKIMMVGKLITRHCSHVSKHQNDIILKEESSALRP